VFMRSPPPTTNSFFNGRGQNRMNFRFH
jgi:hypothetical protein